MSISTMKANEKRTVMIEWFTLNVMRTLITCKINGVGEQDDYTLVLDTLLDDDGVLLGIRKLCRICKLKDELLVSRERGRVKFESEHSDLTKTRVGATRSDVNGSRHTLGRLVSPAGPPGRMPRVAFQRARLSSSASSLAYSSTDFAAVGL
jgi:hypothetical protein